MLDWLPALLPSSSEAIKEKAADFSSKLYFKDSIKLNLKEKFAAILQKEISPPPLMGGVYIQKTSDFHTKKTRQKYEKQQNQLYQQQMLLMPPLQFSMQENCMDKNIRLKVPVESSYFIDQNNEINKKFVVQDIKKVTIRKNLIVLLSKSHPPLIERKETMSAFTPVKVYKSPDTIEGSRKKRRMGEKKGVFFCSPIHLKKEPAKENELLIVFRPRFDEFRFAKLKGQPNLSSQKVADVITQIGLQIHTKMNWGLKEELRVQLKPEHLGSVTLKVSMMKGVLSVDIITESSAVKSIIESHLNDLRQTLIHKGIEVGQLNVSAEGNMSYLGSQGGMFSSHAQDSRGDAKRQNLDGASKQESWLSYSNGNVIDVWF